MYSSIPIARERAGGKERGVMLLAMRVQGEGKCELMRYPFFLALCPEPLEQTCALFPRGSTPPDEGVHPSRDKK